ncbi:TetR/AcrR family transcriptional regulator [Pleionea sp. CnH1-48]|uniref:TetR/AcrR family transcriptional regulator n=1 Tax=Pleionea sp. CnH1-48 TaxID=2954494 RepID=UPI0020972234|nr:TetR/AcrR family transcriptional regulator [Pleionea sp. CnH1-48]MCO7226191.1 TetR/AcrR family transcriptional regulator [Pleionea sp. CnH1-48]
MMTPPRGRPADPTKQAHQKQKLIAAAIELLSEKSYRSVTIREIAERADVNSAMIRYYFENKENLFLAMFEELSVEHFNLVENAVALENPVREFIYSTLNMIGKNTGMMRLIHDEILREDSPLKVAFIERFPKKMAQRLPRLIQAQIDKGLMRSDLNPKFAALSLMSMIIFPFTVPDVREQAWQMSQDDITSPAWAEHLYQLFVSGCTKEPQT